MIFRKEEEEAESILKNSQKLETETVPTFRQGEEDNSSTTPKRQPETEADTNNFVISFKVIKWLTLLNRNLNLLRLEACL